jgi:hypothetical protein
MNLKEAQREFKIRYYLWARSEFEKEINELLPNSHSFKAGRAWETYQFLRQLEKNSQVAYAHAFLKHLHWEAAQALGESLSPAENILLGKHRVFSTNLSIKFDAEIQVRKLAGEKVKFASKRKLQKAVTSKFKQAFGNRIISEENEFEFDPVSSFDINCAGWIISTQFWFGRPQSLIEYHHLIDSKNKMPPPKNMLPAMRLDQHLSWLHFNRWEHLGDADIDPACDAAIKFCEYFFAAAPKLLDGSKPTK